MSKAKDKAIKNIEEDLIAKGFKKLDSKLITHNPPKIKWGKDFEGWELKKQNEYLKKLAATMNHAASLIQDERNQLGELCELKEKQLEKMKDAMEQNNSMIQGEVTKMNEERHKFNEAKGGFKGAELKAKLKEWQSLQA